MRLAAIDPFVSPAPGTKIIFDVSDEPEGEPLLLFSGLTANRAFDAPLGHRPVLVTDVLILHVNTCIP